MNAPNTNRRRLTSGQKRDLIYLQGGICPECGETINLARGDVVEIDHRIPLALGGADAWSNWQAIHKACHQKKTGGDITTIAKAKRVAAKHAGKRLSRHPLPGGRHSKWKRRVGGKTVLRDGGNYAE